MTKRVHSSLAAVSIPKAVRSGCSGIIIITAAVVGLSPWQLLAGTQAAMVQQTTMTLLGRVLRPPPARAMYQVTVLHVQTRRIKLRAAYCLLLICSTTAAA